MSRISIKQIIAGQELSSAAYSSKGRLLFEAGTILDRKKIDVLNTWGVVRVDIKGDAPVDMEPYYIFDNLPFEVKESILNKLLAQYKNCDIEHPFIKELINYQRLRLINNYLLTEKTS
jgi:hypothetical protein